MKFQESASITVRRDDEPYRTFKARFLEPGYGRVSSRVLGRLGTAVRTVNSRQELEAIARIRRNKEPYRMDKA